MIIGCSYFTEFNNKVNNLSFYSLAINLMGKYNFFSFDTEFDIFFSKNFSESSDFLNLENEDTMYGARIDLNVYKQISVFGEWKYTFYELDSNPSFDGSVDKVSYINMGLKLKY